MHTRNYPSCFREGIVGQGENQSVLLTKCWSGPARRTSLWRQLPTDTTTDFIHKMQESFMPSETSFTRGVVRGCIWWSQVSLDVHRCWHQSQQWSLCGKYYPKLQKLFVTVTLSLKTELRPTHPNWCRGGANSISAVWGKRQYSLPENQDINPIDFAIWSISYVRSEEIPSAFMDKVGWRGTTTLV